MSNAQTIQKDIASLYLMKQQMAVTQESSTVSVHSIHYNLIKITVHKVIVPFLGKMNHLTPGPLLNMNSEMKKRSWLYC